MNERNANRVTGCKTVGESGTPSIGLAMPALKK